MKLPYESVYYTAAAYNLHYVIESWAAPLRRVPLWPYIPPSGLFKRSPPQAPKPRGTTPRVQPGTLTPWLRSGQGSSARQTSEPLEFRGQAGQPNKASWEYY